MPYPYSRYPPSVYRSLLTIETGILLELTPRIGAEYDVFGPVRSETGASDNVRKFTGKEYDADVRLYYNDARYYDPYTARFNSRDPAKDGINWYIYAENKP